MKAIFQRQGKAKTTDSQKSLADQFDACVPTDKQHTPPDNSKGRHSQTNKQKKNKQTKQNTYKTLTIQRQRKETGRPMVILVSSRALTACSM